MEPPPSHHTQEEKVFKTVSRSLPTRRILFGNKKYNLIFEVSANCKSRKNSDTPSVYLGLPNRKPMFTGIGPNNRVQKKI